MKWNRTIVREDDPERSIKVACLAPVIGAGAMGVMFIFRCLIGG